MWGLIVGSSHQFSLVELQCNCTDPSRCYLLVQYFKRERKKVCVCVRVFVYTIMVRQSKRKRVSTIQSNRTVPVINIKTFTGPDQQTPTLKHGDDGDLSNCLEVGL